ncbi:MAG: aminotransferase class I/II-fold pyridoxal phosphate-dependent enzyme [Bdellovibrionales bacterium]|nr:aminotransferase class I/II-fold pyridoxal phosphate-dependent enzyme [Bdellovibrionales bacterium]
MATSETEPLSKIGLQETNIFSLMNALASKYGALNLAQGFPNFDCSNHLKELVTKSMQAGNNQYPPMQGILELREAISEQFKITHNINVDPDTQITITPGGHSALMSAASSVLNPGDEVIIFEPAFDCFSPIVKLNGSIPVFIRLEPPEFKINWEKVKSKISAKTKLIIINTPHNPSGTILEEEDLNSLAELIRDTQILVLSDEVYQHIIFDNKKHQSVISHPELADRSFAVFSFGKTYHVTGWKIAYCVAPNDLMQNFRSVHQMITFCVNRPMQHAIAEFLKDKSHYLELANFYQAKRDLFLSMIKSSNFDFVPAKGTYFQTLSYEKISDKGDMQMCEWLAKEFKIALIPMSAFYHDKKEFNLLRVCFAKTNETLEQAAEILCKI